jgi:hypothetical protein
MAPRTAVRWCLIALGACAAGRAVAQTPDTPPATVAPPPAPPPTPPEVAPPPAPPSPPPTAPTVQSFEPADVTGPKAGEIAPVSTEPAKTPTGALPLTMDEMPVAAANNRVTLNMFGDTAFIIDSVTPKQPGFVIGDLDLLITGRAASLTAMAETALEQRGHGTVGIDLERIFVGWRGERVAVDAGRTHAELGYWNNAFHHGRWLQITAERPRILKFEDEGGILPIHLVGVTAHWRPLVEGDQRIELAGSVGNGRGNITDDVQEVPVGNGFDTNGFKSLLFKAGFKGFGARDLQFGVSGMYDRIAPLPATVADPTDPEMFARPALPNQTIQEWIGNAYLAYRGSQLTVISEIFDLLHTSAMPDIAGKTSWNTVDAYALGAYRIGDFSPYLMAEIRRTSGDLDPFFFPDPTVPNPEILRDFEEVTVGVRWDLTTWSAIKLEYRGTFPRETSHINTGTIDWCFGL